MLLAKYCGTLKKQLKKVSNKNLVIYYVTPYSLTKNIGEAYNQYMRILPKDRDWLCIMDGDICFLNFDWGHIIQEVVDKLPNAGLISCYTNRISKNKMQLYGEDSADILVHRLIAKKLDAESRGRVLKINKKVSGFLMIIQKRTWKEMGGFPAIPGKILDIDGLISRRILGMGKSIYLMEGLYVFHYYRMAEGRKFKDHLRDAEIYLKTKPKSGRYNRKRKVLKNAERNSRIIKNRRERSLHNNNLQRTGFTSIQNGVVQEEQSEAVHN